MIAEHYYFIIKELVKYASESIDLGASIEKCTLFVPKVILDELLSQKFNDSKKDLTTDLGIGKIVESPTFEAIVCNTDSLRSSTNYIYCVNREDYFIRFDGEEKPMIERVVVKFSNGNKEGFKITTKQAFEADRLQFSNHLLFTSAYKVVVSDDYWFVRKFMGLAKGDVFGDYVEPSKFIK